MKVLLQDDVTDLGYFGDIVEVKDGYARNYLLPLGLAIVPSQNNIRMLAKEKEIRAKQRMEKLQRLAQVAERLKDAEVVVAAKANPQGHLFGSITETEIGENLRAQGFEEVTDQMVRLGHHLKEVGYYEDITVKLAPDISSSISVLVVDADQAAGKTEEELREELRAKKVEQQQSAVELELMEEMAEPEQQEESAEQEQEQQ